MKCESFSKKHPIFTPFLYFMIVLSAVLAAIVIDDYYEIHALKEIIIHNTEIKEENISEIINEIQEYEKTGHLPEKK